MIDCIILAAGYATRLYPLTRDFPKPLLPVAGEPILDHLLRKAVAIPDCGELIVVSNDRFAHHFHSWRESHREKDRIVIINDGSRENETRIGALRDLALAQQHRQRRGFRRPALVLAGDNLFDFSLREFAAFFQERQTDCITTHHQPVRERLQRTGVIQIDARQQVTQFQEKPQEPASTWAVPPFYIYTAETLQERLPRYLALDREVDAPGSWLPWLIIETTVHAHIFEGARYDIGNLESYREVRRAFGEVLTDGSSGQQRNSR